MSDSYRVTMELALDNAIKYMRDDMATYRGLGAADYINNRGVCCEQLAALKGAIKTQGDPVAEVVESIEADRYFKCDVLVGSMPAVGAKLYTSAPTIPEDIAQTPEMRELLLRPDKFTAEEMRIILLSKGEPE